MATKTLNLGDMVSWNSPQGKVTGSVNNKLVHVAASPDDPQWQVKTNSTGQLAAHKPAALKRVKAK